MTPLSKLTIGSIVVLLALFALVSQFVWVRETGTSHTGYTTNTGEVTDSVLVGQTFVAEKDSLSGIGVLLATYSNRENSGQLELHIRSLADMSRDIRMASVDVARLGDNQIHAFTFDPIPDSAQQTYFFYIQARGSAAGQAITVDIDTRDPYHRGTAYIVKGRQEASLSPDILSASGKPTIDVAFETYQTVRLRDAVVNRAVSTWRYLIGTWPEKQHEYTLWGKLALQSLVVLVGLWLVRRTTYENFALLLGEKRFIFFFLLLSFILAIVFRLLYAWQLPVTFDEGNYLYDAQAWLHGRFAGGDGYVKAPLVVGLIAIFQWIFGNTVWAGRLASVVVSALTIFPLYLLASEIFRPHGAGQGKSAGQFGRRMALGAAIIWAAVGAAVVSGVYVHTQALSLFFGVSGLAILLAALRGKTPHLTFFTQPRVPSVIGWFIFAGVLFGLGVASRKSILALGLVPLLLILTMGDSWKERGKHVLAVGAGFLAVIALFLAFAWSVYGVVGIEEAIGFNSAEDGISAADPDEVEQIRAYSLRGMTPFFRESLPLILLACIGLGMVGEQAIRAFFRSGKEMPEPYVALLADHLVPKLGWIPALVFFGWAWDFFTEYEGQAFMFWGIPWLWVVMALVLFVMMVLSRSAEDGIQWKQIHMEVEKSQQPGFGGALQAEAMAARVRSLPQLKDYLISFLIVPLWVAGLVFFYVNWIKFHANYLSEFMPPLVVLAGAGAVVVFERVRSHIFFVNDFPVFELLRRLGVGMLVIILMWGLFVSNFITYVYEHTGTFDQDAAREAAEWAKVNIPSDQPIFTGAALIPYLSGHRVSLDIAHPRWYAYEFTRKDTRRLNTFLPPAQEMIHAFDEADWFLLDEQTQFSFFMEYDAIKAAVESKFESVQEFENLSNTLTFYRRKSF